MKRTLALTLLATLVLGTGLALQPATPASAAATVAVTGRASVLPGAVEPASRGDAAGTALSGDGRFIVFHTTGRLVPSDTDTIQDVYLKDLLTDQVERISQAPDGSASYSSYSGAVTPGGRYVAFWSWATDLVPGDTNNKADVFVRDRALGTIERVSVTSAEAQANGASPSTIDGGLDLSGDGRYVTFTSSSTNMGADANTLSDVFVRDRTAGTTTLASVSSAEVVGGSDSYEPSISSSGRFVAFSSDAANLVTPDTNAGRDVYVRDLTNGTTVRASLTDGDAQLAAGQSFNPWISDNGASVAFASSAKLAAADTNTSADVYVRVLSTGATFAASVNGAGVPVGDSSRPRISGNGGIVAFVSNSAAFAGANGYDQIYVRQATVTRASVSTAGTVAMGDSANPMLDLNGAVVSFDSEANNLVVGDTGYDDAMFRRTRTLAPTYTSDADLIAKVGTAFGAAGSAQQAKALAAYRAGASVERHVLDLANAPAFAGKRPPVVRLYAAYFLRLPDASGLAYWTKKFETGTSLNKISASFAASSEFTARYGSKTNSQFVTLIYQNIFGRNPDAAGLSYWTKKLDAGTSRGTVMTNFSESSEGVRKLQIHVDLALVGLGLLGNVPSGAQRDLMLQGADLQNANEGILLYLLAN